MMAFEEGLLVPWAALQDLGEHGINLALRSGMVGQTEPRAENEKNDCLGVPRRKSAAP